MDWSNLAKVVYKRTYARDLPSGWTENWEDTVERVIRGNTSRVKVAPSEIDRLRYFIGERKAMPAGRGLWFSGTDAHSRIGGTALNNCWFILADDWQNFVMAQDLLMLGGGVGMSVESEFVRAMPRVRKDVVVLHKPTKDADFIVPDSREGWCELLRRVLEAFFVTGKSFTYSTVCVRGYGEKIQGFGGTASGPIPLVTMVEKLCAVLVSRAGRKVRSIDAGDMLCIVAEMVVAGNVRRSALILIGDPWDKDFLRAKRWDLGTIPSYRSNANYSVACDDVDDLHPAFWQTYEHGEAFGLINRKNIQRYGRMGEKRLDSAIGVNPCGEANLEDGEPCNLLELALPNMADEDEFVEGARLMLRYGKRVTCETYHHAKTEAVVKRNRRIGVSITGCLGSTLCNPTSLDRGYAAIQDEDRFYSKELGIPESIRTTTGKPSGTLSKLMEMRGREGIHPPFSKWIIQRIRFSAHDSLVPKLRDAGHHIEPVQRLDGTVDYGTVVADFYEAAPPGCPTADGDWDTWKQLEILKMVQKHWADQSVSVTVYYKKSEIPLIKKWLADNLSEIKTISFLCHDDHGFKQAPKEAITEDEYLRAIERIKPIDVSDVGLGSEISSLECEGGACPVR